MSNDQSEAGYPVQYFIVNESLWDTRPSHMIPIDEIRYRSTRFYGAVNLPAKISDPDEFGLVRYSFDLVEAEDDAARSHRSESRGM